MLEDGLRVIDQYLYSRRVLVDGLRDGDEAYRQGSDYSDLLDLLSLKTATHCRYGYVAQERAVAKIVDGRLLIREQKRFMIPTTQPIPFPWDASFVICRHITFWSIRHLNRYLTSIRVPEWKIQTQHSDLERIVQCKYCWSEYRIDFKKFGKRGNAMYVTKWLDLGHGPLEYKCRSHLSNADCLPWRRVGFAAGSIYAALERRVPFDVDSDAVVSLKDRKELFKKSWLNWPDNL
jgi:hypothetical protein